MINHDNQEYLNLNDPLNLNMSLSASIKLRKMLVFYDIAGKRIQNKLQVPQNFKAI